VEPLDNLALQVNLEAQDQGEIRGSPGSRGSPGVQDRLGLLVRGEMLVHPGCKDPLELEELPEVLGPLDQGETLDHRDSWDFLVPLDLQELLDCLVLSER